MLGEAHETEKRENTTLKTGGCIMRKTQVWCYFERRAQRFAVNKATARCHFVFFARKNDQHVVWENGFGSTPCVQLC